MDLAKYRTKERASRLPIPPTVVVAILYVGLVRLIHLAAAQRYPPKPEQIGHPRAPTAHWEFWRGDFGPPSLLEIVTITTSLFVLLLWLKLWSAARTQRPHRGVFLLAYIGAAILLASLQYAIVATSRIEPDYDLVRVEESHTSSPHD